MIFFLGRSGATLATDLDASALSLFQKKMLIFIRGNVGALWPLILTPAPHCFFRK